MEPSVELEEGEDMDFGFDWKDGFIDNPLTIGSQNNNWNNNSFGNYGDGNFDDMTEDSSPNRSRNRVTPSSSANKVRQRNRGAKGGPSSSQGTPSGGLMSLDGSELPANLSQDDLAPTRIRRQYNCDSCAFRTINPREFLYHRRDEHQAKVKIVECPYCVYACQYFQKLQRHILLVHKLETVTTPPTSNVPSPAPPASQSSSQQPQLQVPKSQPPAMQKKGPPPLKAAGQQSRSAVSGNLGPPKLQARQPMSQQRTQDESLDGLEGSLNEDEFNDHQSGFDDEDGQQTSQNQETQQNTLKCKLCHYTTTVPALLRKHVKYHTAPKVKCDKCSFESPYSWNVERHYQKCHGPRNANSSINVGQESNNNSSMMGDYDDDFEGFVPETHLDEGDDNFDDEQPEMMIDEDLALGNSQHSAVINSTRGHVAVPSTAGSTQSLTMRSGAVNIIQPPGSKEAIVKLLHCAYCDFTHKESKSMVSHLSVHTGKKPYKCNKCDFSSNWKEVVARHAKSRHNGSNLDVDQLFKYTVNKFICKVVDDSGELNLPEEVTLPEHVLEREEAEEKAFDEDDEETSLVGGEDSQESEGDFSHTQSSASYHQITGQSSGNNNPANQGRYGLSGFRGTFKCDYCPFRAEKAFHIDFHLKRHTKMEGADFKCPHCPYWVNAKKSLVRHIYLHDCENGTADPPDEMDFETPAVDQEDDDDEAGADGINLSLNKRASAKNACDACPFVAGTKTQLLYHKQFHRNRNLAYKCNKCSYSVSHQHLLNQHLKVHSIGASKSEMDEEDTEEIQQQTSQNQRQEQLRQHKVFNCKYCPMKVYSQNFMTVHEQQHEASEPQSFTGGMQMHRCNLCNFMTSSRSNFVKHLDAHAAHEEIENRKIKMALQQKQQQYHNSDQSSPKKFKVNGNQVVNKYSSPVSNRDFIAQRQGAQGKKSFFICRECPAVFKSPNDLKLHEIFHGPVKYDFPCPFCTYKSKHKAQLSKHLYVHSQEYVEKKSQSYTQTGTQVSSLKVISMEDYQHHQELLKQDDYDPQMVLMMMEAQNQQHPSKQVNRNSNNFRQMNGYHSQSNNQKRPQVQPNQPPKKVILRRDEKGRIMSAKVGLPLTMVKPPTASGNFKRPADIDQIRFDVDFTKLDPDQELRPSLVEKIRYHVEQLSLIEMYETTDFLAILKEKNTPSGEAKNLGIRQQFIHKCSVCPASFSKTWTLKFHESLHGYDGLIPCNRCNYSIDFHEVMNVHKSLHSAVPAASSSTTPASSQSTPHQQSIAYSNYKHRCKKCPAAFSKPSRLEKHISLHGSGYKWKCEKCDYAVPYAATLVKHRHIHDTETGEGITATAVTDGHPMTNFNENLIPLESLTQEEIKRHKEIMAQQQKPSAGTSRGPEDRIFACDRCPYTHPRRDAVQSHEKRHELERSVRDGKKCPHCDYVCLQPSYLREHQRLHFEPSHERKARLYRVNEQIEVYTQDVRNNQEKTLLFKDLGSGYDIKDRFVPEEEDEEFVDLYKNIDLLVKDDEDYEEDEAALQVDEQGNEEEEDIPESTAATAASSPAKNDDLSSMLDEEYQEEQMVVEPEVDGENIECEVDFKVDETEDEEYEDDVQEVVGEEVEEEVVGHEEYMEEEGDSSSFMQ